MNNPQKSKADTPAKKPLNSSNNKVITLDNVWSLLSDINNKVNMYDTSIKDINVKLSSLENYIIDLKKSLKNLSSDLSKLKEENKTMSSEIKSLHERITLLENSNTSIQLPDFDIVKESRDRLLKENNLIFFNVNDSESEDSTLSIRLVNEILQDLSSPIGASNAKRIGKPGIRPRPILVQFNSPSEVHSILRVKSKIRNSARWKNVSISMDMTEIQRQHMKSLRSQLMAKRLTGDTNWFIKYFAGTPKLVQKN